MSCSNWPSQRDREHGLAQVDRLAQEREPAAGDHRAGAAQVVEEAARGPRPERDRAVARPGLGSVAHAVHPAREAGRAQRLEQRAAAAGVDEQVLVAPGLGGDDLGAQDRRHERRAPARERRPEERGDDVVAGDRHHRPRHGAREREVRPLDAHDPVVVAAAVDHVDVVHGDERDVGAAGVDRRPAARSRSRRRRAATRRRRSSQWRTVAGSSRGAPARLWPDASPSAGSPRRPSRSWGRRSPRRAAAARAGTGTRRRTRRRGRRGAPSSRSMTTCDRVAWPMPSPLMP